MPLVLASPLSPPASASVHRVGRLMTWTGFNGATFILAGSGARNPRLTPGVKGLHMPPMSVYESSTPLVPGVDLLGYALPKRPVYWPLLFRARNADDWVAQHAGFFDSFHPVLPGTWTVGEGAQARTLQLTGVFDGTYRFTRDPFVEQWAIIGLDLIAPRPLWRGAPIKRTFLAEEDVDFIPDEPGDDYFPSPSATFTSATIPNPGDEPAYLTWIVQGPQETLSLGVGGSVIDVPFGVDEGQELRIDTDPASQFATLDGVDCTAELGFQAFAPVPPRGTSPLTIASSGSGSVTAQLVPLFWRAF